MPDLAGPKIAYLGYTGTIDPQGVSRIAAMLNTAVNDQFDGVYLCISSPGGYVGDGIYLYNHIRSLPLEVTIHNVGSVSSIAVAVFVAAQHRYCSKHAMFMIHPTSFTPSQAMSWERLDSTLKAALADEGRTNDILSDRTSLPPDILNQRSLKEITINPVEAVNWGLVHGVREFSLPKGNKIFQI